jgi:serine/threonine-protein kinase
MAALDRDLLFGLLALQNGLIEQGQLVAAFQAWTRDRSRTLADHMAARGDLDPDQRAGVDAMVGLHLKKHGGDAGRSLAAIPAGPSTRESLAAIGDPEIGRTLTQLASGSDGGPDRTVSYAVGTATSDGLRFRVLRPHARGGLGAVFVAMDAELNREVALKQILDQHADDPSSRSRFLLEAEITGGLEHPGIVPVYGLGTYADGRPFYAMRFIKGDSLKEAAERFHAATPGSVAGARPADEGRRSLEFRKLLRRFTDVCDAIDYAHSRGVLHRDIKPGNIIVGKHGETLVVDWGLAKAAGRVEPGAGSGAGAGERVLAPSSASGSAETLPGSVLGTPAYMSPEQAGGDLDRLGPRSDVYSLGATLYFLLTGRPPFGHDDLGAMLRAVAAGEFPPPRRLDATLDAALEAVCLKAMANRPDDRYASPRALADDVERWMADEPVSAWREPPSRRARRWARRHRTALAVAGVAMLATAAALGVVAVVQTDARNRLGRANLDLRAANDETARARDLAERRVGLALEALGGFSDAVDANLDVKNLPENAPLRQALLRGPLAFYRRLRDDLAAAGDVRPGSRADLADAYARLARLTSDLGSQADALAAYDEAEAILSGLADAGPAEVRGGLARVLAERSALRAQNGRLAEAEADARRALDLREALGRELPDAATHPIARARILQHLADLKSRSGDAAAALGLLDRSREAADDALRRVPGDPEARMVRARASQRRGAILHLQKGQLPESHAAVEAAVADLEPAAAARTEDLDLQLALVDAYARLAEIREELGRPDEALALQRKRLAAVEALARVRPTSGVVRRNRIAAARQLARMLDVLGRGAEAPEVLRGAVATAEALVAENPTSIPALDALAGALNAVGLNQFGLGRVADALASFEAGAAAMARILALDPRDLAVRRHLAGARYNIGYLRRLQGDEEGALAAYGESLEMRLALDRDHPDDPRFAFDAATTLANIGEILGDRGDLARGRDAYARALGLYARLAAAHPENVNYRSYLARNRGNLALLLIELGDLDAADALLAAADAATERLSAERPEVVQSLKDLAMIRQARGRLAGRRGRAVEAVDWLRRSLEAFGRLLQARPNDPAALDDRGRTASELAALLDRIGRPAEAIELLDRAADELSSALARDPGAAGLKPNLARLLRGRAEAMARLGRAVEAADAWSRNEALDPDGDSAGLGPALIAAWSGDPARSLAELELAGTRRGSTPEWLVERARAAALAAVAARRGGADPGLADRCADRAIDLLARAAAAGFFDRPGRRTSFRTDPSWDPLRNRDAFRLLMMDLAMPSEPFARPD